MVRVAINCFGRIGRMVLKKGILDKRLDFVAVNDLTSVDSLAYLFKNDSAHGRFNGKVKYTKNSITINGKKIKIFAERDPSKLPWKDLKVDVVVEATGFFRSEDGASLHLKAGAKKVLVSAPIKGKIRKSKTIVLGVNDKLLKKTDQIVSNGSCTTNCVAPVAKLLNDKFGIIKGYLVTVHAYTASQRVVDGPHKDPRRGRAAALNIIPTTSGAAKAVGLVIPKLNGKLHASAMRVPVVDGSIVYLVCNVKKSVDVVKINEMFEKAAKSTHRGIIEYSREHLVSTDIIGNPNSSIFDSQLTEVDGKMVKLISWYDNEWGYSCRVVDLIKRMA